MRPRSMRLATFALAFACALGAAAHARPGLDTAAEARTLLREEKFPEAEKAFAAFLEANPYDPRAWTNYGFTLHPQKKYDDAIRAWRRAISLGASTAENLYNIACAQSLAGRTDEALGSLRAALDAGFTEDETIRTDKDMDPIRADPRFRQLVGSPPPEGLSRDERWRHDLDYFAWRMERMHYRLYAKVSAREFLGEVEALKRDVPSLDDDAVAFRLRRILARVGDGHTTLSRLKPGQTSVTRMPLDLYLYKDGLYVRSAAPGFEELAGARVERIGTLSASQAIDAMKPFTSVDNEMGYKDQTIAHLGVPAGLVAIGATTDATAVSYTLTLRPGQTQTRAISPVQVEASSMLPTGIEGNRWANAGVDAPEPLYLRHRDKKLWFEPLPESNALYVCFRAIDDEKDETLAAFWQRVFDHIDSHKVDRLIIDMRHNGGGNTGLVLPFLHGLIGNDRVNKPGSLFVIIGRRTFSAAMNTVSLIEAHTNATFVGEPTGSSPNFVGESTSFMLPCNNLKVYCSSRYWQHVVSLDKRVWIPPAITAELSFADFAANRDPAMDAILRTIAAQQSAKPADASSIPK